MGRRYGVDPDAPNMASVVEMDFVDRLEPAMRELVNEYGLETVTSIADFINPPVGGYRASVDVEQLRRALRANRRAEQNELFETNFDILNPLAPTEKAA